MLLPGRASPTAGAHPGARTIGSRAAGALLCLALTLSLALGLAACAAPSLNFPVTLANTPAHGVTVPAVIKHGAEGSTLVVVDVEIEGKGPYPMALDTGASLTLIDSTLANRLGLPVAGNSEQITGVGGAQRVTPVSVSQWSVGQAQLPAMTVTSAPLPDLRRSAGVYGLLGSDMLDRFGAVTIDYTQSQVTFYQINPNGGTNDGGASSSREARRAVA